LIGWTPIFFGYSIYGSIKFGLYELLKDAYKNILGLKKAKKFKKIGWTIASGLAELFANTFLYPWLEIKRIMQLSRTNP
jgi:solute carrier family 25 phosphate transporter 3